MTTQTLRLLAATFALVSLGACAGAPSTQRTTSPTAEPASLTLPGDHFHPESVAAAADGTLYVSSVLEGSVLRIGANDLRIDTFIPAEAPIGKTGVLVDEPRGALWVGTLNTTTFASTLRRYNRTSFALEEELPLARGVCNDFALDDAGNLYVTDSFFGILRLRAGGSKLEPWASDRLFTATHEGAFAVNGIVRDRNHLYIGNLDRGLLLQVDILDDGSASAPSVIAGLTLTAPDGIRLAGPGRVLVTESLADILSEVVIDAGTHTGVRTVLARDLDRPASVAVARGAAWVAEGQIARAFGFDKTTLHTPFRLRRIGL